MYVLGGTSNNYTNIKTIWRWNQTVEEWESVSPLRSSRCAGGVTNVCDNLYLVGGEHDDSVERFDLFSLEVSDVNH